MVPPSTTSAAPSAAPSQEVPEIRRPDLQMMLQDLTQARRDVYEERKNAERRVNDEKERSRDEVGRVRRELTDQLRDSERQNDVLVRTLGRLQGELDRVREENARLRYQHVPPVHAPEATPEVKLGPASMPARPVTQAVIIPPSDPLLGKPVPLSDSTKP